MGAMVQGVGMPTEAFRAPPHVTWGHIDGPLMSWAGRMHWLTRRERFAIWIGRETVESIADRHWPERKAWRAATPTHPEPHP